MRAPSAFAGFRLALALWSVLATLTCAARPVDEMGVRIGTKRLSSAVEGHHACLVRADGNITCWGNNASGQIGDGTSGNVRNVPVAVSGITTAVPVAAGRVHSCALLASGTVQCWGSNASGQLGAGSGIASSSVPATVTGLNNVTSLAAGTSHTCAGLSNGTVRCLRRWKTTSPRFTPVNVSNLADAVKIVAGATHTCAVRADGTAACWGRNDGGAIGDGTTTDRLVPTALPASR